MSLSIDGVWKTGVWAETVWAEGTWREGAPIVIVSIITLRYNIKITTAISTMLFVTKTCENDLKITKTIKEDIVL